MLARQLHATKELHAKRTDPVAPNFLCRNCLQINKFCRTQQSWTPLLRGERNPWAGWSQKTNVCLCCYPEFNQANPVAGEVDEFVGERGLWADVCIPISPSQIRCRMVLRTCERLLEQN